MEGGNIIGKGKLSINVKGGNGGRGQDGGNGSKGRNGQHGSE